MPNVFLINITERERAGMVELLEKHPGRDGPVDLAGSVAARLVRVEGVPVDQMPRDGPARRYYRTRQVTSAAKPPANTTIVQGRWWEPGSSPPEPLVSVVERAATLLKIEPGSRLEWEAAGRPLAARVASVHRTESAEFMARFEFILSPGALDGLPVSYNGGVRIRPAEVPGFQRVAWERYPTVTVINAADVLEIVQEMVDQIALVVRFVAAFAILAGAIILSASVAGTRFRRMREVVILKTLGATRRRIAAIFSVEFLALGTVAGLIGGALATAFTAVILKRLMDAEPQVDLLPNLAAVGFTALIAAGAGWLASYRILGQKPLEILREE
jgi:putative ABC transport system permease protein